MKTSKKARTPERNSLPRKIADGKTLGEKMEIAADQTLSLGMRGISTERDAFTFVHKAKWLARKIIAGKLTPKEINVSMFYLGFNVVDAAHRNDFAIFSRIASVIQFSRRPNASKLHYRILEFCHYNDCGRKDKPADPRQLLQYLRKFGHYSLVTQTLGDEMENQVPRSLWTTCDKIKVVLTGRRAKKK